MASYTITHLTRIDNYAVVQVLEDTEIEVGQEIVISSASDATFDGTHTVISTEPYELIDITDEGDLVFDWDVYYPNQAIFIDAGDDVERDTATGTVTYTTTCSWIDADDIAEYRGIESATANDTAFLTTAANAANAFAYRRRTVRAHRSHRRRRPCLRLRRLPTKSNDLHRRWRRPGTRNRNRNRHLHHHLQLDRRRRHR